MAEGDCTAIFRKEDNSEVLPPLIFEKEPDFLESSIRIGRYSLKIAENLNEFEKLAKCPPLEEVTLSLLPYRDEHKRVIFKVLVKKPKAVKSPVYVVPHRECPPLKKKIPIIFGINRNYLYQSCVVIGSILRNTPSHIPRPIEFFILIDTLPSLSGELIPAFFAELGGRVQFILIEPLKSNKEKVRHFTDHMYYRYSILELFASSYEKAIYLDADTVVTGNIFSLFDNLQEDEGLAVRVESSRDIGTKIHCKYYFNSGVMGFSFRNIPDNFL